MIFDDEKYALCLSLANAKRRTTQMYGSIAGACFISHGEFVVLDGLVGLIETSPQRPGNSQHQRVGGGGDAVGECLLRGLSHTAQRLQWVACSGGQNGLAGLDDVDGGNRPASVALECPQHSPVALERLRTALNRIVAEIEDQNPEGFRNLVEEGQKRTREGQ